MENKSSTLRRKERRRKAIDQSSELSRLITIAPVRWGIVLVIFLIIAIHLFTGLDTVNFHGDEAWWSSAGYYYTQLMFIDHDFSSDKWGKQGYWEFGLLSPPAGKYFIGLAMHFVLPPGEYYYPYKFEKSPKENQENGLVPPHEVLRPGRAMAAIASFITCVVIFFICFVAWDWIVGVIASVILAFNGLFSLLGQRVMTDAYLNLFLCLSVLCCILLVKMGNDKSLRILLFGVISGIIAGVCISVKLNGIIALLFVGLTILYMMIIRKPRSFQRVTVLSAIGLLTLLITAGTVIALNPMFYTTSISELISRVTVIMNQWSRLIASQQQGFSQQAITGFPWRAIEHLLFMYTSPVLTVIAIIGLARCAIVLTRNRFSRGTDVVFVVTGSTVITLILVLAWIPLDWDRYYLPMVVMLVPFSAFGLTTIVDFLYIRVRKSPV